jgi:isopentenyl-diphosphate Delta-isomerase
LGAKSVADLQKTDLMFHRDLIDWCDMRRIDYKAYGKRS